MFYIIVSIGSSHASFCFTLDFLTRPGIVPFRFSGLSVIGTIFFLLNLVLFVLNVALISFRFATRSGSFQSSFLDPAESLFVPASIVSVGTILLNIAEYGPTSSSYWLQRALLVLFWGYAILAILTCCGFYLILWNTQTFLLSEMMPIWIFPAYPLLLLAPIADILTGALDNTSAWRMTVGAVCVQGVGFTLSILIYSAFIHRLMIHQLPAAVVRPGMFVSVGPSGFTAAGIIGIGDNIQRNVPSGLLGSGEQFGIASAVLLTWTGIFLWGVAIWFFLISVGAHLSLLVPGRRESRRAAFDMTWYTFVFPNTALVTATLAIGKSLHSRPIEIIGIILAIALVATWMFVFVSMVRAVLRKKILWPRTVETN